MRLSKEVLLEIVVMVQEGLLKGIDVSENLRKLDVEPVKDGEDLVVGLSYAYLKANGRLPKTEA